MAALGSDAAAHLECQTGDGVGVVRSDYTRKLGLNGFAVRGGRGRDRIPASVGDAHPCATQIVMAGRTRHEAAALHSRDLVGGARLLPREHDSKLAGAHLVVRSRTQRGENLEFGQRNARGVLEALLDGGVQLTGGKTQCAKQRNVRSDLRVHALRVDECLALTKGEDRIGALYAGPMTTRRLVARASLAHLSPTFDAIRAREGVSLDRPAAVAKEAVVASERDHDPHIEDKRTDLTAIPFVTLDPAGARDLDQAVAITRTRRGWRVRYAIADVGAHVIPGGAIDRDAWERVETVYCPDMRAGLHPPFLAEGFASLLPGQRTKAVVWDMAVSADGSLGLHDVTRAWVRSRKQYAYDDVRDATRGEAAELAAVLSEVGTARRRAMDQAGAMSLPRPSQVVTSNGKGLHLEFRAGGGVEDDNAQISLMTGMVAARLMLDAGVGVLRTMPSATDEALARLRRQAEAIGIDWPAERTYAELLHCIDPSTPRGAAFLTAAVALFRGARWEHFDVEQGIAVTDQPTHGALAAPYAHVTAPLRRLVDRYGTEVCLAYTAGRPVPAWAREGLQQVSQAMATGVARSGRVDRACVDAVEAAVLAPHLGRVFSGVGLDEKTVQLENPAVVARCKGEVAVGRRQRVRLLTADVETGPHFEVVPTT